MKTTHNLQTRYAFAYRLFNVFHNDNIEEFLSTQKNFSYDIKIKSISVKKETLLYLFNIVFI